MSTSGFHNATITKVLAAATAVGAFVASSYRSEGVKPFVLSSAVLAKGEVWRLILSHFMPSGPAEAIVSLVLLYRLREFERYMGSHKFSSLALFALGFTTLTGLGLIAGMPALVERLSPGPFGIIFSLLVIYGAYLPSTSPATLRVLGLPITEKLFTYLLAGLLAFSDGVPSILTATTGLVAGLLWLNNVMLISSLRVPRWLVRVASVVEPAIASTPPGFWERRQAERERQRGMRQEEEALRQAGAMLRPAQGAGAAGAAPPGAPRDAGDWTGPHMAEGGVDAAAALRVEPDAEKVQQLAAMGFDEQQARDALAATDNNIEAAANRLLGAAGH